MSLLKTKVEFISNYNDDGQYRKETLEFLFQADTFCTAEKATIAKVKQDYHPQEDGEIKVLTISPYSITPDMKAPDEDMINMLGEHKWFEIHVKSKELKEDGGIKFVTYKYLKQAANVTHAEKLISTELGNSGELFDDYKIEKVIQMKFKEVIA